MQEGRARELVDEEAQASFLVTDTYADKVQAQVGAALIKAKG